MKTIVFIHKMDIETQQHWLDTFTDLLPQENIVLEQQLTDKEALNIELAIVANPDIKILERFPNLIWVQSLWAGVESLVEGVKQLNQQKQIQTKLVRLIDPQLANTMAEAVLTWTLYLHRNIPEYTHQQRNKIWKELPCAKAQNVRVSILGAGELGQASMQRLLQNNYQINSWSRTHKQFKNVTHYSGDEGLITLLQNTDILVCLLPLTKETYKLLNKQTLSHAVLDVFEKEPLPTDNALWEHPYISILPHISATTNLQSASQVVATNILKYRSDGSIPSYVDLDQGY